MDTNNLAGTVGIFFIVNEQVLLHTCTLKHARAGGDFLNYPFSHDEVWCAQYARKYGVDFDYFPRGRILFNKPENLFYLYYDACVRPEAEKMAERFTGCAVELRLDEHYQCHQCNPGYVI